MIGQDETRLEHDPLGEMAVPRDAYYGAQTARAVANFPISGMRPHPEWVRATVMVKKAAAQANMATGRLDRAVGEAIVRAADEVLAGGLRDQFVVDAFQAGAGTSHNMNANEVLANRASELLGEARGVYRRIHPNDHVNMAQSSNDVIPTSIRLAALFMLPALMRSLDSLAEAFEQKARQFDAIVKPGRTHLQDAVPIRLGQVFAAYATTVRRRTKDVQSAAELLCQLNIGATAIGTGLNAEPEYRRLVIERLRELTGLLLREPDDYVEITRSMGDLAHFSGSLRTLALELSRIANDLRLLSSGPRTGLAEIRLPAVQPGSSIMPGKVNPVMAEMLNMVCFQVVGNDVTIGMAAEAGQMELNVMTPVIALNVLQSLEILANGVSGFTDGCVRGIEADAERCHELVERSAALATALTPYIGYETAAAIAKESLQTGRSIRQIVEERGLLKGQDLEAVLSPEAMTEPGIGGKQ